MAHSDHAAEVLANPALQAQAVRHWGQVPGT
jgi:hypothetical protein